MKTASQMFIPFPDYKPRKQRVKKNVVKEPEAEFKAHAKFEISEVDLIYKSKTKASDRPQIKTSKDSYEILKSCWDDNHIDMCEEMNILLLNRANRVLGCYQMSKGGITGTVCDPRLAFTAALKANATSIVLAHNHPSMNLKPSKADEELTQKFKYAGAFLDIMVLDHLIVTRDAYFSFADEGLL